MVDLLNPATVFIIFIGLLFIALGVLFALLFQLPSVLTIGMGIVGIFLLFLPVTRQRYKEA